MAIELWKVVKTADLKPGDEVRFPDGERYFWTDGDVQSVGTHSDHYPEKLQKYTGPSVEVLMLACEELAWKASRHGCVKTSEMLLEMAIDQAIRELESEAGDGR